MFEILRSKTDHPYLVITDPDAYVWCDRAVGGAGIYVASLSTEVRLQLFEYAGDLANRATLREALHQRPGVRFSPDAMRMDALEWNTWDALRKVVWPHMPHRSAYASLDRVRELPHPTDTELGPVLEVASRITCRLDEEGAFNVREGHVTRRHGTWEVALEDIRAALAREDRLAGEQFDLFVAGNV